MQLFLVQTLMSVNLVWTTVTKVLSVLIQKAVTYAHAEKATVAMEDIALVSFVVNYMRLCAFKCRKNDTKIIIRSLVYAIFPVQTLMSVNLVWTTVTKMLTVLIQKALTHAHAEKATSAME